MKLGKRTQGMASGLLLLALLVLGCGDETVGPGPGTGPGPVDLGPFRTFEVFLRPYAVQRPTTAGGTPTPILVEHYLAAFYTGGTQLASFEWIVPASVGAVEPKTPSLNRTDATVNLRLRQDADLRPGFFEIEAHGQCGDETSVIRRRFAVVENTWMKHQRTVFRGLEPADLILWPTFLSRPGAAANADTLVYVESPSPTLTRIRRLPAFRSLAGSELAPDGILRLPLVPESNNYGTAPQTMPDIAPYALGRREVLFVSRMDPQWPQRCPSTACGNVPPFRIWVCQLPDGFTQFEPRALTQDTTYIEGGNVRWRAYDHESPRWDPKATNPNARIAFVSNRAGIGQKDLWLANLVDLNGDARSDTLMGITRLTTSGGIGAFAWDPDPQTQRICAVTRSGLAWIGVPSGVATPLAIPDSSLSRFASPSVFWRQNEHTLVAFEAVVEELKNIFVLDEQDQTLVRLLPYSVPVTHNLFPRWHPTRKQVVYVSDYTVMPWANTTGGSDAGDRLNPNSPELYGMQRTYYPSPWVVSVGLD